MDRKLIDIQEHCYRLRQVLCELDQFVFMSALEWLDIAAGIENINVLTAKYDTCLMYCGCSLDYEDKRSELLSQLAAKLTIFNFVWGSFESIAKAIELPHLPRNLKRSRGSIVDRAIWFLKQSYSPKPHVAYYDDELYRLRKLIENNDYYKKYTSEFKFLAFGDLNGLGLHIVRKLRNELAHGCAQMPEPDKWETGKTDLLPSEHRHLDLIDTCTRVLLLSIQMILLADVFEKGLTVRCLLNEDGLNVESTAEKALYRIHFHDYQINRNQLSFFE